MEYKKRMKRLLLVLLVSFNVYGSQNNDKPVDQLLPDSYFSQTTHLGSYFSQATLNTINMLQNSSYNSGADNNSGSLHSILKKKPNKKTLLDARLLTPAELCAINTQINAGKIALPRDSNKSIKKRPADSIIDDPKINKWLLTEIKMDQEKGMQVDLSLLIDELERNQK